MELKPVGDLCSHALRFGAGVAVHLSKIRAKQELTTEKALLHQAQSRLAKSIAASMNSYVRGGVYKNGAVVLHLDIDHPGHRLNLSDVPTSANCPWAKRCVNLRSPSFGVQTDENLRKASICKGVARGDIWLAKIRHDQNWRSHLCKRLFRSIPSLSWHLFA